MALTDDERLDRLEAQAERIEAMVREEADTSAALDRLEASMVELKAMTAEVVELFRERFGD